MQNVNVSCFKDYYSTEPRPVGLLTWLTSDKYADTVEQIRAASTKAERDDLKAKLPAITPSGLFSGKRESGNLIQHSGFIQIDIDFQDNEHITNFAQLKAELCKLPEIAYLGLSVSGTGFWGLIPLAYPSQHKEQFDALLDDFLALGIKLDPKPRNVVSLRGYSYDPDAYLNPNAKQYRKVKRRQVERYDYSSSAQGSPSTDTEQNVLACLNAIERGAVDITGDYSPWFEIGCALANEFGEAGRAYYHRTSQFSPKYKAADTDRQFTHCLRRAYRFSIGTFFKYAKEHGISYAEMTPRQPAAKPRWAAPQQPAAEPQPTPEQPEQILGLPPGFAMYGDVIEVDGIPAQWLNPTEMDAAIERARGYVVPVTA